MGTWVVIAVVVLIVLWLFLTYNGLVAARNRTQEAWSEIDVELKRRHDLIPNLVSTVQGYVGHERGTLEAVTNARAAAVSAGASGDPAKIGAAENMLTQSLRSLFAVTENYPDLHRGQDRVFSPLLQRKRPRLQHQAADPADLVYRRRARLQAVRLLPGRRGRSCGTPSQFRQHAAGQLGPA